MSGQENKAPKRQGGKDADSPFAIAEVGTTGSFVEGLLVKLKVQGSDRCFLLQIARAVLGPGRKGTKL